MNNPTAQSLNLFLKQKIYSVADWYFSYVIKLTSLIKTSLKFILWVPVCFLCLSVTARQICAALGEYEEALQEYVRKQGGGEEVGDLAWPVGGLIPVQALELLSSAVAQIFRFGLGCHVGSEILCSRLLPRSIQGLRGALGWRLKRRLSFLQKAKLLKGVSVCLSAAWSVRDARGGPRRELRWDSAA